ncbi:hypothetical protein SAMN05444724_2495 [Salinivibrio sp. ES.052]|nr:hypothetical protein SAMN05444724_2495 [Salinivibrio sp. ES.052]
MTVYLRWVSVTNGCNIIKKASPKAGFLSNHYCDIKQQQRSLLRLRKRHSAVAR